jgi:hypothetical protein
MLSNIVISLKLNTQASQTIVMIAHYADLQLTIICKKRSKLHKETIIPTGMLGTVHWLGTVMLA